MANSIDSFDDMINVSDITDRIDELREERDADLENRTPEEWAEYYPDDADELKTLEDLADGLQGMGGDHQWEGNWYPGYLIRDSHFKDYAMELAYDIGAIDSNASWPRACIDWDQAARELRMDYSSVEFEGVTYWCR